MDGFVRSAATGGASNHSKPAAPSEAFAAAAGQELDALFGE